MKIHLNSLQQGTKLRGKTKYRAALTVLSTCASMGLPEIMGPLWDVMLEEIERDPVPYMLALEIDVNTIHPKPSKPFDQAL